MFTTDTAQDTRHYYAAILLDDGSELVITDDMLEQSLNDPAMIELSQFMPDLSQAAPTLH